MHPLAPKHDAPQHRPRPLPLFMAMVADYAKRDPVRAAAALRGLKRYQDAPRSAHCRPHVPGEAIGRATVYDYGGNGRPVLLVPSIINPPFVLDMADDNSLALALSHAGFAVRLLDWGAPTRDHADETLGDLVATYLLEAIDRVGPDVQLVGHCLGGTLAIAAASIGKVAGVATIASPWDFSRYAEGMRDRLQALWQSHREDTAQNGIVPLELLQLAFWSIDPDQSVAKFAVLDGDVSADALARFVALEDWANSGAPLPHAAARELFEGLIGQNLTAQGRWIIGGKAVSRRPDVIAMQHFVSTTDRIVPATATPDFGNKIMLDSGHIGMVVGQKARHELFPQLIAWLRR